MSVSVDPSSVALRPFGIADAADAIRDWIVRARWFGGKQRRVERIDVDDLGAVRRAGPAVLLSFWEVTYADGGREVYSVPLGVAGPAESAPEVSSGHVIATLPGAGGPVVVYDALADPGTAAELWRVIVSGGRFPTGAGHLESHTLAEIGSVGEELPRLLGVQQSNSALVRGQRDFVKWCRRMEAGPNAELEMGEALSARGFPHVPTLRAHLSYRRGDGAPALQALLQDYLHNGTEGWAMALTSLRDLYAAAEEAGTASARERHEMVEERGGSFQAEAARLGEVTAELHLALADPSLPSPLTPRRAGPAELELWAGAMLTQLDALLAAGHPAIEPLRAKRTLIAARFEALRGLGDGGMALRGHGDYHLGQALRTDEGWKVIDFGGEPARDPGQRRELTSPLRDVAGMLRSFDYAAAAALGERVRPTDPLWPQLFRAGQTWANANREAFWFAYVERVSGTGLLPEGGAALTLRRAFELDKAVYEVGYELGHRPDWVAIPLRFLLAGEP